MLQDALKARVPSHIIQLKKRLVDLVQQPGGGVELLFKDGTSAHADLVIGADGIRSVSLFTFHLTLKDLMTLTGYQGCPKSYISRPRDLLQRNDHLALFDPTGVR